MGEVQSQALDGLSRKLAEFTVNLKITNVPAKALENAKIAILDCLGVALRAAVEDIGRILMRFARGNFGPGPCTVWGSDMTANPRDAALINGALAHGLDYDDRGHASTYTLAAAMAAGECRNASGTATLEAFIVGREVRMCLDALFAARSTGRGPGARGWHSNGILGPIAAACAACKVFGLDIRRTLAAIGLGAGSCAALTRDGGTMAKPFRVGHAAATGLTCALLAAEGFTSDEAALDAPYGLFTALGPLEEGVLDSCASRLGTEYNLATRGVEVKQFACCTATHAAIEAILRLVHKGPVQPSDVDFIECDLRPYPLVRVCPGQGFEGRFSMAYCLGIAFIYGRVNPEDFTDEKARDPQLRNLIERCRHLPNVGSVVVGLKNGTRISEPIQPPKNLEGWEMVSEKFSRCADRVLPDSKRLALLESVANLEAVPSIRTLTGSLQVSNAKS